MSLGVLQFKTTSSSRIDYNISDANNAEASGRNISAGAGLKGGIIDYSDNAASSINNSSQSNNQNIDINDTTNAINNSNNQSVTNTQTPNQVQNGETNKTVGAIETPTTSMPNQSVQDNLNNKNEANQNNNTLNTPMTNSVSGTNANQAEGALTSTNGANGFSTNNSPSSQTLTGSSQTGSFSSELNATSAGGLTGTTNTGMMASAHMGSSEKTTGATESSTTGFAFTISNNTGAAVTNNSRSILDSIGGFFAGLWEDIKKIGAVIVDFTISYYSSLANLLISIVKGVAQFLETLVDLLAMIVVGAASAVTGIIDACQAIYGLITGNEWHSLTKSMWKGTMGFVAEDHVGSAVASFYKNTGVGQFLDAKAHPWFKSDGVACQIGSGIGYAVGLVVLTIATAGIGGAAVGAAGTAVGVSVSTTVASAVASGILIGSVTFSSVTASTWAAQRDQSWEGIERAFKNGEIDEESYTAIKQIYNLTDEEWQGIVDLYKNGEISEEDFTSMKSIREMPTEWKTTENLLAGFKAGGEEGLKAAVITMVTMGIASKLTSFASTKIPALKASLTTGNQTAATKLVSNILEESTEAVTEFGAELGMTKSFKGAWENTGGVYGVVMGMGLGFFLEDIPGINKLKNLNFNAKLGVDVVNVYGANGKINQVYTKAGETPAGYNKIMTPDGNGNMIPSYVADPNSLASKVSNITAKVMEPLKSLIPSKSASSIDAPPSGLNLNAMNDLNRAKITEFMSEKGITVNENFIDFNNLTNEQKLFALGKATEIEANWMSSSMANYANEGYQSIAKLRNDYLSEINSDLQKILSATPDEQIGLYANILNTSQNYSEQLKFIVDGGHRTIVDAQFALMKKEFYLETSHGIQKKYTDAELAITQELPTINFSQNKSDMLVHLDKVVYDVTIGNDSFSIVAPKNIDSSLQSLTIERVAGSFSELSSELRQHVKQIEISNDFNVHDNFWQQKYEGFINSMATGGNGTITYYRNDGRAVTDVSLRNTMTHEVAHNMDQTLGNNGFFFSQMEDGPWIRAIESDLAQTGYKSPTEYGTNSVTEDFAESLAFFNANAAAFEAKFPSRAKVLTDIMTLQRQNLGIINSTSDNTYLSATATTQGANPSIADFFKKKTLENASTSQSGELSLSELENIKAGMTGSGRNTLIEEQKALIAGLKASEEMSLAELENIRAGQRGTGQSGYVLGSQAPESPAGFFRKKTLENASTSQSGELSLSELENIKAGMTGSGRSTLIEEQKALIAGLKASEEMSLAELENIRAGQTGTGQSGYVLGSQTPELPFGFFKKKASPDMANSINITASQQQRVNQINAMIKNGQTINLMYQNTADISSAMLRQITDLSKVNFVVYAGLSDANGNFKAKYANHQTRAQEYLSRITYNGYEMDGIVRRIEGLQARVDMSLSTVDRARQIYEMLANEFTFMRQKVQVMENGRLVTKTKAIADEVTQGLRGITSNNKHGKEGLVCAGYSQLFYEVANRSGINAGYIRGRAVTDLSTGEGGGHAWNVVITPEGIIPVDVTWRSTGGSDWFGPSQKFAAQHIADSDETYKVYDASLNSRIPDISDFKGSMEYIVEKLDAKYGIGKSQEVLNKFLSEQRWEIFTRTDDVRNVASRYSKEQIIQYIELRNAVNQAKITMEAKYGVEGAKRYFQNFLEHGTWESFTRTNGVRDMMQRFAVNDIKQFIESSMPDTFVASGLGDVGLETIKSTLFSKPKELKNVNEFITMDTQAQIQFLKNCSMDTLAGLSTNQVVQQNYEDLLTQRIIEIQDNIFVTKMTDLSNFEVSIFLEKIAESPKLLSQLTDDNLVRLIASVGKNHKNFANIIAETEIRVNLGKVLVDKANHKMPSLFLRDTNADNLVAYQNLPEYIQVQIMENASLNWFKMPEFLRKNFQYGELFQQAAIAKAYKNGLINDSTVKILERMYSENPNNLKAFNFELLNENIISSLGIDFVLEIGKFSELSQKVVSLYNNSPELFNSFAEIINQSKLDDSLVTFQAKAKASLDFYFENAHILIQMDPKLISSDEFVNYIIYNNVSYIKNNSANRIHVDFSENYIKDFSVECDRLFAEHLLKYQNLSNDFNKRKVLDNMKDIFFQKYFSMSYVEAQTMLAKYGDDITEVFKYGNDSIKNNNVETLLKYFRMIENTNNLEDLVNLYNTQKITLTSEELLHLDDSIRELYARSYVDRLTATSNQIANKVANNNVTKTLYNGKEVNIIQMNDDFSFFVHSNDSGFVVDGKQLVNDSYIDSWYQIDNIRTHGLSTSYITSENIGSAPVLNQGVLYAFTNIHSSNITAMGPYDISGYVADYGHSSSKQQKFISADNMSANTTRGYNEFMIDRNSAKPDAIILYSDASTQTINSAIKAAAEWDIPIIKIDKEELAKNQLKKIDSYLNNFTQTKDLKSLKAALDLYESSISGFMLNASVVEGKQNYMAGVNNDIVMDQFKDNKIDSTIREYIDSLSTLENCDSEFDDLLSILNGIKAKYELANTQGTQIGIQTSSLLDIDGLIKYLWEVLN